LNIADALDRNTLFFPTNDAVVDAGRRWNYVEFRRDADRFAHALVAMGVQKGDRVCVFLGNSAEFALAFYGIFKIGAIAVSISAACKTGEVEYQLGNSESSVLVTSAALIGEVPSRDRLPLLREIVSVGASPEADVEFWELVNRHADASPFATLYTDREDGAEIIFTSGTTGKPKGVVLTHGNVVSNVNANAHVSRMTSDDRLLCFLPMYHSFAQNFIFNGAIGGGATLVIQPKFELEPVLKVMCEEKVTRWHAVPTIYIMLLNNEELRAEIDAAFASVNFSFSAAAAMPAEIARQWGERFGLKISEGWGLTESTPSATYNHEFRHKAGTVGTPIENVEVQVWDEHLQPLPPGNVGELVIKGPNVMKCYYNNPEATAETIVNGWLRTGDVGIQDDEGYFAIVDRVKDMVNSAGLKIWPREVEEVLYEHVAVAECAVIGVPDALYGETVMACIVLREGAEVTPDELINLCKAKLSSYKAPKIVEFMDCLPKNPSGKILKTELRRMAGEK
jgi:long-chain acyl-CoA synthetase